MLSPSSPKSLKQYLCCAMHAEARDKQKAVLSGTCLCNKTPYIASNLCAMVRKATLSLFLFPRNCLDILAWSTGANLQVPAMHYKIESCIGDLQAFKGQGPNTAYHTKKTASARVRSSRVSEVWPQVPVTTWPIVLFPCSGMSICWPLFDQ